MEINKIILSRESTVENLMKLEIYKSQRIHDGAYTRYNPIQPCMLNKILPGIKKK